MLFQSLSVWLSLCYPSSLNLFRNSKQADVYFLSLWPLQTFQYSGVLLDWGVISLIRAPRLMGEPSSIDLQRMQGGYSECAEASEGLKKPVVVEKSPQLGQFWPQQQKLELTGIPGVAGEPMLAAQMCTHLPPAPHRVWTVPNYNEIYIRVLSQAKYKFQVYCQDQCLKADKPLCHCSNRCDSFWTLWHIKQALSAGLNSGAQLGVGVHSPNNP